MKIHAQKYEFEVKDNYGQSKSFRYRTELKMLRNSFVFEHLAETPETDEHHKTIEARHWMFALKKSEFIL